jgi:hypothetical protein
VFGSNDDPRNIQSLQQLHHGSRNARHEYTQVFIGLSSIPFCINQHSQTILKGQFSVRFGAISLFFRFGCHPAETHFFKQFNRKLMNRLLLPSFPFFTEQL